MDGLNDAFGSSVHRKQNKKALGQAAPTAAKSKVLKPRHGRRLEVFGLLPDTES